MDSAPVFPTGEAIMAGRRPGVPPNENHRHRNVDPVVGRDGWTEISPDPFAGAVPEIPSWVDCSDEARLVYAELARLPQAATWGPGTWLSLHLTLPLVGRYLSRPGSENFKAIIQTIGASLALTESDLAKARIKVKVPDPDLPESQSQGPKVTTLQSRRQRLTG
jgi:hypothetical protein